MQAVLDRRLHAVHLSLGLATPLVGLGASAPTYYPRVAAVLGAESRIPAHADVANAVGAVVGRVRLARECVVSAPSAGQFIVHAGEAPAMFVDLDAARSHAHAHLLAGLEADMVAAGAPVFEVRDDWHSQTVHVDGIDLFVEGRLTLVASGRPELAH